MAIKNTHLGGTDWGNEGIATVDLNDTFNETKKDFISVYPFVANAGFIVGHSGTIASYSVVSTRIDQTTDYTATPITWTSRNTNVTNTTAVLGINCKADRTYAIALEYTGDGGYTINSGTTWVDTTADPANVTSIQEISFPTTTLAVAFGVASSGTHIWLSTDNAVNWAQVTATTGSYCCGDMFDGTTGFAIRQGSNQIDITSNSAANWADSGRNAPGTSDANWTIFAVSATEYLIGSNLGGIYKGTTGVDATIRATTPVGYRPSRFIKTANGNIYALWKNAHTDQSRMAAMILFKSTDDGDTWTQSALQPAYHDTTNTSNAKYVLSESADNKLILLTSTGNSVNGGVIEIDVS
jgi:hypothetical protein